MENFNEQFGSLLAVCRENAIEEVCAAARYQEMEKELSEIRGELEDISPEVGKLTERYAEAAISLHALELNRILLCGLTLSTELRKYFDSSAPEYMAFAMDFMEKN